MPSSDRMTRRVSSASGTDSRTRNRRDHRTPNRAMSGHRFVFAHDDRRHQLPHGSGATTEAFTAAHPLGVRSQKSEPNDLKTSTARKIPDAQPSLLTIVDHVNRYLPG